MQASDVFQFIQRFASETQKQTNSQNSCHFLIKYWGQDGSSVMPTSQSLLVQGLEGANNNNDEGFMGLIDFNSMILPRENQFIRALVT